MCEAAHARVRQRIVMFTDWDDRMLENRNRIAGCLNAMDPAKRLQLAKLLAKAADGICGFGYMELLKRALEPAAHQLKLAATKEAKIADAAEALRVVTEVLICRKDARVERLMARFEAHRPSKPVVSDATASDGTIRSERSSYHEEAFV